MPIPVRASSADQSDGVCAVTPIADVTIAAVVFGDGPLLELNRRLTERLNPNWPVRWRVVRNLPVQEADRTGIDDTRVDVVDGVEFPDELRARKNVRSYHHALGLNVAVREIATRYLILIDPDCFIVRPNWLDDVLSFMNQHRIAFFGTPYHPRSPAKLRYFPCSVFLVIDTETVPASTLDWLPGLDRPRRRGLVQRGFEAILRGVGYHFRIRAELSEDTGIRVYSRHRRVGAAAQCVQPVMLPEHLRRYLKPPKQRVLEKLLPDRYCMLPKRHGYLAELTFADFGHGDTAAMFCEQFMWRGEPFALHLRGAPVRLRTDHEAIARLLDQFP